MTKHGGTLALALIGSIFLMGTASSIIIDEEDDYAQQAEDILDETLNQITTYLKIDDAIGKYNNERKVEQIIILVKQFITSNINLKNVKIQLKNKDDITILNYNQQPEQNQDGPIFSHSIWSKTGPYNFSILALIDNDQSITQYNIMNKDTAFILIKLPTNFIMKKNTQLTISIIHNNGITSSITLNTPSYQESNIISFNQY